MPDRVDKGQLVKEVHAIMQDGIGHLQYCLNRDERGLWCGKQPAWLHLHDLVISAYDRAKVVINRRLLAQLPIGVSFHFVFSPDLPESDAIRTAFKSAGFKLLDAETYVCARQARSGDVIDTLTGKSIKGTLRRARRDLEIVEMSADEFLHFHQKNLEATGKRNYRDAVSDRLMLYEGLQRNHVRIIAVRRKATAGIPGPFPIDAATACLWDEEDGTYKLWRLTHRPRGDGNAVSRPHVDATKLLILAAMEDAAARNLILDTDGSTPGLAKLFALFGPNVFRRTTRLQCDRETLWAQVKKYYPSVFPRPRPTAY
jgi:hypothetical protein